MFFIVIHAAEEYEGGNGKVDQVDRAADEGAEDDDAAPQSGEDGADHTAEETFNSSVFPHLEYLPIESDVENIAETDGDFRNIGTAENTVFRGEIVGQRPKHGENIHENGGVYRHFQRFVFFGKPFC